MPYYVYLLRPVLPPEKLATFDAFPAASLDAKARRAAVEPGQRIKVIFAEHETQAEDLLVTPREAPPAGDD